MATVMLVARQQPTVARQQNAIARQQAIAVDEMWKPCCEIVQHLTPEHKLTSNIKSNQIKFKLLKSKMKSDIYTAPKVEGGI